MQEPKWREKTYLIRTGLDAGMLEWHAHKAWKLDLTAETIKNTRSTIQENMEVIEMEDVFNEADHEIANFGSFRENDKNLDYLDLGALQEVFMEIDEVVDEFEGDNSNSLGPSLSTNDFFWIRSSISKFQLPSWLKRPSRDLGDPSAGKVRSADWIDLFKIIIPFVIIEMKGHHKTFFDAFVHLARLSELAMDYEISEEKILIYIYHLVTYCCLVGEIYPELNQTPNNHVALHLPQQLWNFGPTNHLAAWHFEHINGILQRFPTIQKQNQIDLAMLSCICQASNLGIFMDSKDLPEILQKIEPVINNHKNLWSLVDEFSEENKKIEKKTQPKQMKDFLPKDLYYCLIELLDLRKGNSWIYVNEQKGNFKKGEVPVPIVGKFVSSLKYRNMVFSVGKGLKWINAVVEFHSPLTKVRSTRFGLILGIFQHSTFVEKKYILDEYLCVYKFPTLDNKDSLKVPYKKLCPELDMRCFYQPPVLSEKDKLQFIHLIHIEDIVYHVETYTHSSEAFGTSHKVVAVKLLSRIHTLSQ
ncbi:hypothetical protein O181_013649 [Austropuccinia psidii MF-1]|uniref:Uncharacterized protein n=1 Tax=Austropuccinia psidii MF-1 TaxID=1389203 RepID=A0A9Q3GP28_9BASI|nr:hypothetical protein [Austropuccinia psidii MF-1]